MKVERIGVNQSILKTDIDYSALFDLLEVLRFNCIKNEAIFDKDSDLFYDFKKYTISDIMELIECMDISKRSKEYLLNKDNLYACLIFLVMQGKVLIGDVIGGDNTYQILPRDFMGRSYFFKNSDISVACPNKFLVVSDTHIGDNNIEDFSMIHTIFRYAKYILNIDTAIHLGDVFQGIRLDKGSYKGYNYSSPEVRKILDEQLEKFQKYFPDFLKVIAIEGNKDESIVQYLSNFFVSGSRANHMLLSFMKPNFHLLRKREYGYYIDSKGIRIGLSHPLRFNDFFPYVKTYDIDRNDSFAELLKKVNSRDVDVSLSGHYHFNVNRIINDDNGITRRVCEVAPSLSKLCYETEEPCCAIVFRFITNEDNYTTDFGITPLYYRNNKVVEGEERIYSTNSKLLQKK